MSAPSIKQQPWALSRSTNIRQPVEVPWSALEKMAISGFSGPRIRNPHVLRGKSWFYCGKRLCWSPGGVESPLGTFWHWASKPLLDHQKRWKRWPLWCRPATGNVGPQCTKKKNLFGQPLWSRSWPNKLTTDNWLEFSRHPGMREEWIAMQVFVKREGLGGRTETAANVRLPGVKTSPGISRPFFMYLAGCTNIFPPDGLAQHRWPLQNTRLLARDGPPIQVNAASDGLGAQKGSHKQYLILNQRNQTFVNKTDAPSHLTQQGIRFYQIAAMHFGT